MNEEGYGEGELTHSSNNSDAIRVAEQQNIDKYGGAQSDRGTSGNKIRGTSESNPNKGKYMSAYEAEFGAQEAAEEVEIVIDIADIIPPE